ncbi:hypothetical protein B0H65DRAFT_545582 [Neurospora tetraspora]|uniref:Zinc knuckle domain-containing protein n=1 Tax=Neurospora tetraspora TaxID=94610 RepID=A0AAE0JIV8_9PEZI|nr:hypothetical protein B0H65DRAFT_545582 [Neurospora tetraspora]
MKPERQKQLQQRLESGGTLPLDNDDGSLEPSIEKATGTTTRKCANCGAEGHIKTNKKLCPLLNGSMPTKDQNQDDGASGVSTGQWA